MSKERLILSLSYEFVGFQNCFKRLKPDLQKEVRRALAELSMVDIDNAPAKLHLHALKNKEVVSVLDPKKKVKVYTFHVTSSDSHKASFTFEDGCAYMRYIGAHDDIDKAP